MVSGQLNQAQFAATEVQGVSTDSRSIRSGQLFVPLKGDRFDAHDYTQECLDKGAAAVFWQQDKADPPSNRPVIFVKDTLQALQQLAKAYREQLAVRVVGVTGSNGKTTTKDMIYAVLSTTYKTKKTEGNLNNHIGLPLTLLSFDETTEMAVVEMGMSNRHEIELLTVLAQPEVAVITNIGESHLLNLGSRNGIAQAKLEILKGLKDDGLFIYPSDEPLLQDRIDDPVRFAKEMGFDLPKEMKTLSFGMDNGSHCYPLSIARDGEATHLALKNFSSTLITLQLLGDHNIKNAIAACCVGKYMGVDGQRIAKALGEVKITGMRQQLQQGKDGVTFINDAYNASPTSVKAALSLLKELPSFKRKIVVLGDMLELGEREVEYHTQLAGDLNEQEIDAIFTYGELAQHIVGEAKTRFGEGKAEAFSDKKKLIDRLSEYLSSGDLVLVKGSRGMRLEEVIKPFLQEGG